MTTDQLIEALAASKRAYDDALLRAFQQVQSDGAGKFRPLSEERAKLAARLAVQEAGLEDQDVIRWRLRARIGYRSEQED